MAQTAASVHIDSEIKPKFDSICKELGLSINAAINIFARAVVREGGISFLLTTTPKSKRVIRSARARIALQELQEENDREWSIEEINALVIEHRKSTKK